MYRSEGKDFADVRFELVEPLLVKLADERIGSLNRTQLENDDVETGLWTLQDSQVEQVALLAEDCTVLASLFNDHAELDHVQVGGDLRAADILLF